jgi:Flp pilus assembly protein TadD
VDFGVEDIFAESNGNWEVDLKAKIRFAKSWGRLVGLGALLATCLGGQESHAEPRAYIEPEYGPRFYLGDENTRLGRAHFIHGDYGLAEVYFRHAVETTRGNGAAWVGLAASYDRLGRFDLADRAYGHAARVQGLTYVILNNHGYSYLLRGNARQAARLFYRAAQLAPFDLTVANNIAILQSGQAYFEGGGPYIWGWDP